MESGRLSISSFLLLSIWMSMLTKSQNSAQSYHFKIHSRLRGRLLLLEGLTFIGFLLSDRSVPGVLQKFLFNSTISQQVGITVHI
jgi:hypothetical protein